MYVVEMAESGKSMKKRVEQDLNDHELDDKFTR